MKKNKKPSPISYSDDQEELIINLKKELVILNIKHATKQNFKPHLIKQIKNRISKILTLDKTIE
uniref:Ribosomal protein L29 n=1 Tax=Palisada sp. TaxID=1955416 RepID=A0A1Z1MRM9_9FLOR|nr:ribosomal protein L29 [Palisada sp.]